MYKSGYNKRSLLEAFEDNFIPEPNSGCWLWLGAVFDKRGGYGSFTHTPSNTIVKRAHRIAWKLYRDPWLTKDSHVLHHCDNVLCVNPDHLFLGNQTNNMHDKCRKGRHRQGENHPFYKHGLYVGDKKNYEYPTEELPRKGVFI